MLWLLKTVLLSNVLAFSALSAHADALRGKIVADVRCGVCHHLNSKHIKVGPGLAGIYGQPPTITGVPFDVWDEISLDAWMMNPRRIKANTKMVMTPLTERDRKDIIDWLKSQAIPQ